MTTVKTKQTFTIANEKAVDYYSASPERLTELEKKRDKVKAEYDNLVGLCRDMRAVLGLDDPSFLTRLVTEEDQKVIRYNKMFFAMCEENSGFSERYASNPVSGEAELADRMLLEGQDEEC